MIGGDERMIQEQQWINAARRGDQSAFGELVRLYERRVFALTSRMCPTPEDAAEAAQDAFLAAWQGLPSFRGEASFSTWLYRLTLNACTDLLRRESRRRSEASLDDAAAGMDLIDPAPSPQEAAERTELRELIEAGLRALSPEHRQVLILRELHQLSYEEIAQALSLDLGTVKSRISRGRRQLSVFLTKQGNLSRPVSSKEAERRATHEPL